MRKRLVSLFIFLTVLISNAEIVEIDPTKRDIAILLPEKPIFALNYSANELIYHIRQATGYTPCIIKDDKIPEGTFIISLGETTLAKQHKITGSGLKHNQAWIYGDQDKLIITGNDRGSSLAALLIETSGTLFAVYDILENSMNCRWLWPGELGTVIPKSKVFKFEKGKRLYGTKMKFFFWRQLWGYQNSWSDRKAASGFMVDEVVWLLRHRSNRDLSEQHYPHGFEKWPQKYLKSHPDWFNLLPDGTRRSDPTFWDGQAKLISMCDSSPEFHHQIVKDWLENFNPRIPRINLKGNDTLDKCVCDTCLTADASPFSNEIRLSNARQRYFKGDRNWAAELGSRTERKIKFYQAVMAEADRMAPEKKAKFSALVYANYHEPPTNARLDRFILAFCPPIMFPLTAEKVNQYQRLWEGWSKTGAEMVMRPNFTLNGHCYPINFARAFFKCYKFAEKHSLVGADYDSLTGMYGANGLTLYTIARLQNAHRNITFDQIEHEYLSAFGKAAPAIRKYFAMTEKISQTDFENEGMLQAEGRAWNHDYLSMHKLFTKQVFKELAEIINEARKLAENDSAAMKRVEFLEIGLEHARLTAEAQNAYDNYKISGDYMDFGTKLEILDSFRLKHSADNCFNAGFLTAVENSEWPRSLLKLMTEDTTPLPIKWKFALDPEKIGEKEKWFLPEFNDSAWRLLRTDMPWEDQLKRNYDGWGWYRLEFSLPEQIPGDVAIIIGAVDEACEVWLNGKHILSRPYPFDGNTNSWQESFMVNTKKAALPGRNIMTVKVIDNLGKGGIYKPCFLKFIKAKSECSDNLVKNSSFAQKDRHWSLHQRRGKAKIEYISFDGETTVLRIAAIKAGNRQLYLNKYGIWTSLVQQCFGLKKGKKYLLSVTFRTDHEFDGSLLIYCHSDTQTTHQSPANIQLSSHGTVRQWATLTKEFTANRSDAHVYLNYAGNKGGIYIAKVSITQVKE